jgi:transcriptional regulator GlxA family with amidase domain
MTTAPKPLKVLFHLHPVLDTLDFTGPLEVLSQAIYPSTASLPTPVRVFEPTVTAPTEHTTSGQQCIFRRHIPLEEAYARLAEFDVLVIPGGSIDALLAARSEPLDLVRAFFALEKVEGRTRTLLSICTGSLVLATAGVLKGLTATTHPNADEKLRVICGDQTTVVKERYVVNRVNERGLRVVTSGGVSCGMDACVWLVKEVSGEESAERVLNIIQYAWRQGVVV